jgi:hypothetical protein
MANGARLDSSASGSGWHATPAPSSSTHSRIIASSSHPFAPSVLFWVELKTRQKLDTKCCFLFICLAPKTLTPDRLLFCFRGIFERPRSKIKAYRAQSSLCTLLCLCLRTAPAEGRIFFFRIISHCPSSGRSAGMLCRSHVFYSGDLSGCGAGWCDVSNGCPLRPSCISVLYCPVFHQRPTCVHHLDRPQGLLVDGSLGLDKPSENGKARAIAVSHGKDPIARQTRLLLFATLGAVIGFSAIGRERLLGSD